MKPHYTALTFLGAAALLSACSKTSFSEKKNDAPPPAPAAQAPTNDGKLSPDEFNSNKPQNNDGRREPQGETVPPAMPSGPPAGGGEGQSGGTIEPVPIQPAPPVPIPNAPQNPQNAKCPLGESVPVAPDDTKPGNPTVGGKIDTSPTGQTVLLVSGAKNSCHILIKSKDGKVLMGEQYSYVPESNIFFAQIAGSKLGATEIPSAVKCITVGNSVHIIAGDVVFADIVAPLSVTPQIAYIWPEKCIGRKLDSQGNPTGMWAIVSK